MQRACFLLRIKESRVEEYRRAHEVWPEMLDAIRNAGIRNYSLFLRDDGLMAGYMEAENVQESLRQLGQTDVNRRWQEHMAPYFESGSGDLQEGGPQWLEQVFYTA